VSLCLDLSRKQSESISQVRIQAWCTSKPLPDHRPVPQSLEAEALALACGSKERGEMKQNLNVSHIAVILTDLLQRPVSESSPQTISRPDLGYHTIVLYLSIDLTFL
jgi:hypothetical protein